MEIGIQVSSLKPLLTTEEEVRTAFACMKALGCHVVQLQWIDPKVPPQAVEDALKEQDILCVGVQDFYTLIRETPDYYTSLNTATGGPWVCISRIPEEYKSVEGLIRFAEELRQFEKKLKTLGQKLCFHPVTADFTAIPGMDAVEALLELLPELPLCLDLYHLNRNCDDMPRFIRRYGSRICMVHFKDSKDGNLVPAGQGDTHWSGVVEACLEAGVPYAFAEQETWNRDPYDCLKEAMEFIRREIGSGNSKTNVL